MINSHFIPQLILRHFCENDKIQYYDIKSKKIEPRSTKTVFSEKGYYPEELEKDLCQKIEVQFANILNKKLQGNNYRIVLTREELFVLKKFLIISILRVKEENMKSNGWYQVLRRDGFIPEDVELKDLLGGDFFENINTILECDNFEMLFEIKNNEPNMNLFTYVNDILGSYMVFVRTNNCKEDFVIPDRGWAGYRGPMSVKKLNALYNMLEIRYDPFIDILFLTSSPLDYAIFPLASNFAVIVMSPAFKVCLPGMPYNIIYPEEAPSLSQCLGFGSSNTIMPPKNKFLRDGTKEYHYDIQQLSKKDTMFLNSILIKNVDHFFGFANEQRVRASIEYYSTL